MSLPWFRLYRELKDDPKIGVLSDAEFRCYIESLCWACEKAECGFTGLNLGNVDWAFRRPVKEVVSSLAQKNLLSVEDGEIFVPAWEKRQRASDDSKPRVEKFRAKKNVTVTSPLQKRDCNGTEESRVEENIIEKKASKASPQLTDEQWMETIKSNPAYSGIDVVREHGKAIAWCDTNRRQCTRRFFINWLNRAEKPLAPKPVNPYQPTCFPTAATGRRHPVSF